MGATSIDSKVSFGHTTSKAVSRSKLNPLIVYFLGSSSWGSSWSPLGRLGGLLGRLGAILGVLEHSWAVLKVSWTLLARLGALSILEKSREQPQERARAPEKSGNLGSWPLINIYNIEDREHKRTWRKLRFVPEARWRISSAQ